MLLQNKIGPARRVFVFGLVVAMLTVSGQAWAQTDDPNETMVEESIGVPLAHPSITVRPDATSISTNPGNLALTEVPDVDVVLGRSEVFGEGFGVFAVVPIADVIGFGAGVEWLRARENADPFRRYMVAMGVGLGRFLGFGLRYTFHGSEDSLDIDGFSAVDVGLTLRLFRALVLSVVVEHANTPRFRGTWLDPIARYGLGVVLLDGGLRFDGSFSTGVSLTTVGGGGWPGEIRAGLAGTPIDGLDLFADAQIRDDVARFGGGVELGFGMFAARAGAYGNVINDTAGFDGVTASLTLRASSVASLVSPSQRWIRMKVAGSLPERAARLPFGPVGRSFASALLELQEIARDPSIDGLVLDINGMGYGFGQLWELRQAILLVRESGKKVVAHIDNGNTRTYYFASAADKVYMSPGQALSFRGISTTLTFYRDLFDLLGVEPEFVKIDEYKTAPDAFLRNAPAETHEEQLGNYLDALFDELVVGTATSRNMTPAEMKALVDDGPMAPNDAEAAGMIDGTAYEDELPALVQADFGLSEPPKIVDFYAQARKREESWSSRDAIVVLHIDGSIVKGPNIDIPLLGQVATGSDTIIRMADWARESPDVAAVVLRVDSGGGSAHASELMHRALSRLAETKPLIVSMGSIAASGGYYVAAPGARIFAAPTTLTGSIGIFSGKFNLSRLLDVIGINRFVFQRGRFADLFSSATGWDEEDRRQILKQMEYLYGDFVQRVADGRGMTVPEVRSVGEGRVWTGEAALQNGLVDEIGGLLAAIDAAKEAAGRDVDEPMNVVQLPVRGPLSGIDLGISTDIIGVMQGDESLPEAATTVWSNDDLVSSLIDLPRLVFYRSGDALMMVPFELRFDD